MTFLYSVCYSISCCKTTYCFKTWIPFSKSNYFFPYCNIFIPFKPFSSSSIRYVKNSTNYEIWVVAATRRKRYATSTTLTELALQTNAQLFGNFDLKNEPSDRRKILVDNDELKDIVEADDTQSTTELSAAIDVSVKSMLVHFYHIGKVKRLDKCVPHELLTETQMKVFWTALCD